MTEPKYVLLGIAGMLFFILSGLYIFSNVDKNGALANDPDYKIFNNSFQKLNEFQTGIEGIKAGVDTSESSSLFDKLGIIESLVQQAWNSLKLLITSFSFLGDIFSTTATLFGVPAFVVALATLSVTIVIVFGVLYIIFNRA
jgi:hypothetical protein